MAKIAGREKVSEVKANDHTLDKREKELIYLASGFFNDSQKNDVDLIEQNARTLNLNLFSPRQEEAKFTNSCPLDKKLVTWMIFKNNLMNLNLSDSLIANLRDYDMGTMWELGYFVGKETNERYQSIPDLFLRNKVFLHNDDRDKFRNEFLSYFKDPEVNYTQLCYDDLTNAGVSEDLAQSLADNTDIRIICLDDRPPLNVSLVGYYNNFCDNNDEIESHRKLITWSAKNYGTNLMLVHAAHHMSLDKLTELGQNQNKLDEFLSTYAYHDDIRKEIQ